jgi:hypothetical protein
MRKALPEMAHWKLTALYARITELEGQLVSARALWDESMAKVAGELFPGTPIAEVNVHIGNPTVAADSYIEAPDKEVQIEKAPKKHKSVRTNP